MAREIKVGLLGLGTVGTGVVKILTENWQGITSQTGIRITPTKALVRNPDKARPYLPEGIELTKKPEDVIFDPEIDIIVEVMGGVTETKELLTKALENGKYVVTANKDLIAQYGGELLLVAERVGKNVFYEASVGGGIPLIRPLKNSLGANRIKSVLGIINGTTNYILTQMTINNRQFDDVLSEAQEKGFAEQDPSSDLDGKDAAYKLTILASLAFRANLDVGQVCTESIRKISLRDIQCADELGFVIKLLAIGEETKDGVALKVHPTLVPKYHPLASVHNEFNAVYVVGDAVGEVMFYGRGAGSLPTASSVVADILEGVRSIKHEVQNGIIEVAFENKKVVPVEEQTACFYLRLQAVDQPGVFASLAVAFGEQQVSLDMIVQKSSMNDIAEVVLVTHEVREAQFQKALSRIREISTIRDISNVIRVLKG